MRILVHTVEAYTGLSAAEAVAEIVNYQPQEGLSELGFAPRTLIQV